MVRWCGTIYNTDGAYIKDVNIELNYAVQYV